MRISGKILKVGAFLTLAAWANAQAMACCWLPGTAETARAPIQVSAPMAGDHSCCPGKGSETPESKPEAAQPDAPGHSALCCAQEASPAESVAASNFSFPVFILATVVRDPVEGPSPGLSSSPDPFASPGPPRYLALRRILI
jgi:hypothetical protein